MEELGILKRVAEGSSGKKNCPTEGWRLHGKMVKTNMGDGDDGRRRYAQCQTLSTK